MTLFDKHTINRIQWQQLVENSNCGSWFQTPEAFDFYSSLSFLQPFVFGVAEKEELTGVISGFIQADGGPVKRFFSRRAIVNGGALLHQNISEEALRKLLQKTQHELKTQAIYIEFRNFRDYSGYKTVFEKAHFNYRPHLNFQVATPNIEFCLKNLQASKRRYVKLSQKNGVEWMQTDSKSDLESFYSLLKKLYATKVKTPLFPYEYFEQLMSDRNGKIFIVKYRDEVIGGSACVAFENKILFNMFVCGLDGQVKNVYPSTVATWASIEFAAENGFEYFDMMGAGKPNEGYGVRDFKAKFGGKLVENGRFLYLCRPLLYKIGKFGVKILKKK